MGKYDFIPGTKDYRERLKTHVTKRFGSRPLSAITHIAIHHSLTKTGSAESFARYHVNDNNWPGIGYHFVIGKDGIVKWCHDLEVRSYHVGNSNRIAVGVCMVGDFRSQELLEKQLKPTLALVKWLMRELSVPIDNVWGHSQFPGYDWKACPVINMDSFREGLQPKPVILKPEPNPADEASFVGPADRRINFPVRDFSEFLDPNTLTTHPGESVIQAANRLNQDDIGAIKTRNKELDLTKPNKKPQVIKVKGPVEKLPPKVKTLIDSLKAKSYAFFKSDHKPYNLNIVGVRSDNAVPNSFDDKIYVFWKYQNQWQLKEYKATTDPGLTYLTDPINDDGTAILKEGQYRSAYKLGKHRNKYEALVQAKEVTVIRDFDRDNQLDFDSGREQTGFFGINIHHASYTGESTQVNRWSAGCQVFANIHEYNEFMNLCRQARSEWGEHFTYTLLNEKDFVG